MLQALDISEYDLRSRDFVPFGSVAYNELSLLYPTFMQKPTWRLRNHPV